jgi:hypothetical protein
MIGKLGSNSSDGTIRPKAFSPRRKSRILVIVEPETGAIIVSHAELRARRKRGLCRHLHGLPVKVGTHIDRKIWSSPLTLTNQATCSARRVRRLGSARLAAQTSSVCVCAEASSDASIHLEPARGLTGVTGRLRYLRLVLPQSARLAERERVCSDRSRILTRRAAIAHIRRSRASTILSRSARNARRCTRACSFRRRSGSTLDFRRRR